MYDCMRDKEFDDALDYEERLNAVVWMFGFTKKQAKIYLAEADADVVREIVKGFRQQAKLMFED